MRLRSAVETATKKVELRRAEDPVDAVLCAYIALHNAYRPDAMTIYGDVANGYIVTPTLLRGLTPARREPAPEVAPAAATVNAPQPADLPASGGSSSTALSPAGQRGKPLRDRLASIAERIP